MADILDFPKPAWNPLAWLAGDPEAEAEYQRRVRLAEAERRRVWQLRMLEALVPELETVH